MVSSMDGVPITMDYNPAVLRLRDGNRYLAVQPDWCAVASSLSCFSRAGPMTPSVVLAWRGFRAFIEESDVACCTTDVSDDSAGAP